MSVFTMDTARIAGENSLKWAFSQSIAIVATDIIVNIACRVLGIKGLASEGYIKDEGKYYTEEYNDEGKYVWREAIYSDRILELEASDPIIREVSKIKFIISNGLSLVIENLMLERLPYVSPIPFTWKKFIPFVILAGHINHYFQAGVLRLGESECVTSLRKYKVVDAYLLRALSLIPRALFMGALYTSGINQLNTVRQFITVGTIYLITVNFSSEPKQRQPHEIIKSKNQPISEITTPPTPNSSLSNLLPPFSSHEQPKLP